MGTLAGQKSRSLGAWADNPEAERLALERLNASGLGLAEALTLRLKALSPAAVARLSETFDERPAIRIDYLDPYRPGEPLRPFPQWPPFYRLRYLGKPQGFAGQADPKKIPRYAQPPDSGVCAYFPLVKGLDWPAVLADPARALVITEGEFKAAKACREGVPTIGLGGVWNWRSAGKGLSLLPELARVNWLKRDVVFVFDSDLQTNSNVADALWALAEELADQGALPRMAALPDLSDEGKTGLDDFLVARPVGLLWDYLGAAQPLTLAKSLHGLNSELVYIRDPGLILVKEDGQRIAPAAFKDHAYSTRRHAEQVLASDGTIKLKQVSAAQAWLRWPFRAELSAMTYAPGKTRAHGGKWNLWPGWGCEPKKGDVGPFLTLLRHLFKNAGRDDLNWFLRWLAYPIQYPGVKMFTSVMLHGHLHGTGKTLVGYTMGQVYGPNFTEITQDDIHANFNDWIERKQFILADEITGSNKRGDGDRFKKMISQQRVRINPKFIQAYEVPDVVNYLFTSNHPDALFLEDSDRRFYIIEVINAILAEEFYVEYGLWLDGDGPAAVMDYLLHLDLSDFNPAAPAPMTSAKTRMIADTKSDLGAWVQRLIHDPEGTLRLDDLQLPSDLFTNRELLQLYDPIGRTGTTANGLGRELRRAGLLLANEGVPIKGPDGRLDRYYIVRNTGTWARATPRQVGDYLKNKAT